MQEQLRRTVEDTDMQISGVGASPLQRLMLERDEAIIANNRQVDTFTRGVVELAREVREAGGNLNIEPFRQLINTLSDRNVDLANKNYSEGLSKIGEEASEAAMKTMDLTAAVQDQANALAGIQGGIASYLESISTLAENIEGITVNAFKGLEDAIVSLTTTGTFNFRQFALSVIEELTRMVTRMLIIAPLLQVIQSLIPGGSFASAGKGLSGTGALATSIRGFSLNAKGSVFAANGVVPFAMGGVVNRPTLFPFAKGTGLMGEAGPEAIIPLKRGADGKLGVAGGGGTSVVVNVDASGSQVQSDSTRGEQLGRAISQAVQQAVRQELIKQRRPGGLLAA